MSDPATWRAVDDYVVDLFGLDDPDLAGALARSREADLPDIQVSPPQGALLEILARAVRARTILELGTLGGYSTIHLARGLAPGGRVLTLELDPGHASVAAANFEAAGLDDRVEVVVGPAMDSLERLTDRLADSVDLVFLDADKSGYPDYLDAVLPMCRPGALIVADNVVRGGSVADVSDDHRDAVGARRFNAAVARNPRLRGTVLQTVGHKDHDGFAIAIVLEQGA